MSDITRDSEGKCGQARDSGEFDTTHTQLFVWDNAQASLVGAYRLGRTEVLERKYGASGRYLSQMFQYDDQAIGLLSSG